MRESLQKHYIYTYDGACKVLGLEATILAMRPHTPSSSHITCLFGRWARAPNPVTSRLETWQSSWHPYSRRARQISRPFEPKCSRSDRYRLDISYGQDFRPGSLTILPRGATTSPATMGRQVGALLGRRKGAGAQTRTRRIPRGLPQLAAPALPMPAMHVAPACRSLGLPGR